MTRYTLDYADSRSSETIEAEDDVSAEMIALARIGDDAVAADQWDHDGDEDGRTRERLLIWDSEDDSVNDDGAKSAAQLTVIR